MACSRVNCIFTLLNYVTSPGIKGCQKKSTHQTYLNDSNHMRNLVNNIFFHVSKAPMGLDLIVEVSRPHSIRHTTFGRTPLDEWSARRKELYLTTHNTDKRQTSAGFEPAIPASERPQTHALDRTDTGIGWLITWGGESELSMGSRE